MFLQMTDSIYDDCAFSLKAVLDKSCVIIVRTVLGLPLKMPLDDTSHLAH
jgi:hypothetical protein